MNADEKTLNLFTTRVRQLILEYKDQKAKNRQLRDLINERDGRIQELEQQLAQAKNDYQSLKVARMISISDGDIDGAKERVAKLIRDVDKCITLLNQK